jgi:hypothetical protein
MGLSFKIWIFRNHQPDCDDDRIICVASECVSDCCLMPNSAIIQLYHGENKLIFNEMIMGPLMKKN